jgi:hypothetical protein
LGESRHRGAELARRDRNGRAFGEKAKRVI